MFVQNGYGLTTFNYAVRWSDGYDRCEQVWDEAVGPLVTVRHFTEHRWGGWASGTARGIFQGPRGPPITRTVARVEVVE